MLLVSMCRRCDWVVYSPIALEQVFHCDKLNSILKLELDRFWVREFHQVQLLFISILGSNFYSFGFIDKEK